MGGAWECFGGGGDDDDDVVITADTSAHFRLFTETVFGTPSSSSSSSSSSTLRAREEEMRWRIETLDRELGKTKRGKRAFEGLKEGSIRGSKECALEVTEQKRLADWDSYGWLFAQVYAHVVILMKVVGDDAENRKDWVGMDEFEEILWATNE